MNRNFPGHYTPITSPAPSRRTVGNLINMSSCAASINDEFDNADVPLSSTLVTSPNSPLARGSRMKPFQEEPDEGHEDSDEPEVVHQPSPTPPPRSPTPVYSRHPRWYFNDGTVFILMDECIFRVHEYHFQSPNGNAIVDQLGDLGTERCPLTLPQEVKASSLENLLSIIYRRPLDSNPIPIRVLKDACLTAHALGLIWICTQIAKHIIETDCPDESLDEAVPKYTLAIKLPDLFPRSFKEVQVDKLCCAAAYMSHSHFYELGFTELAKVWKAAFVARAGYDGQKVEIYEPQPALPRASYLIKVKNIPTYRAIKKELF